MSFQLCKYVNLVSHDWFLNIVHVCFLINCFSSHKYVRYSNTHQMTGTFGKSSVFQCVDKWNWQTSKRHLETQTVKVRSLFTKVPLRMKLNEFKDLRVM